ncbi:MAG: 5'-methylthioadenosine/adenosylhomocysteine nucleosidase [Defluviitaleaceae bacterium]|nr:5'-methylthioadenosine/adenosylhomocysteine nucleosidase [Defluviitaleaceae bacterium]
MIFGIIGALDEEITHLKSKMEILETEKFAGCEFFSGQLHGKDTVLVKCGIGKVNAAVCTQALIDGYGVDCVINTGAAGSMDEKVGIGDVVISTDLVQHDYDTSTFGDEIGAIPRLGMKFFEADEALVTAAHLSSDKGLKLHKGRIATGDQFIADRDRKDRIKSLFSPLCVEMEGAAIAHACYLNQVPFVVIRSISDNSDGDADISFEKFVHMAAKNSSLIVEEILRNY